MAKYGFDEEGLHSVSCAEFDDLASAPADATNANQFDVYVKGDELFRRNDSQVEFNLERPPAVNIPFDSAVGDNHAVGDNVQEFIDKSCAPTNSQKPTYLGSGEVDFIEIFSSSSQVTANRVVRVDFTYDANLNPTTEVWKHYDTADGTTVLKTFTLTHIWTGADYTKTTSATT